MLEDLQGARLGWEHPFVQCRMQLALRSIRTKTPMTTNDCSDLVPDPEILGPQSPLAFVRFSPPNDDFADEVYYPPVTKKAFDDRFYNTNPLSIVQDESLYELLSKTEPEDRNAENLRKELELRILLEGGNSNLFNSNPNTYQNQFNKNDHSNENLQLDHNFIDSRLNIPKSYFKVEFK